MIIFRYLSKDVLVSTFAVTLVLLLIMLSGRFVGYLADAAQGKLAVDVLFFIMGYRMPGFLEVILPIGFFIGVLLVYGRLYIESEMVVLSACGMSPRQLITITLIPTAFVALLVAFLSVWIAPLGAAKTAQILEEQRNRSEFESLNPGRFQAIGQGQTTTYIEHITDNRKRLGNVFIARRDDINHPMVAVAESGEQYQHPEYQQRYLVLKEGFRYEGKPGTANFRITRFSSYGQYMPPAAASTEIVTDADAKSTIDLWKSNDTADRAALHWRLSAPVLVFVACLLAVPLSRTNPRQGRYLKMLPALIIYIFYFTFLMSVRGQMDSGKMGIFPGLWIVHIPFILLALVLINWPNYLLWRRRNNTGKLSHA
ncbi:MAG: LPS export ABC transporter permease LptF [Chitinophagaceae bacterium]|nr:MAG: LPS export ABC transporter permease LptF [Chitinophagaceae bacterium]